MRSIAIINQKGGVGKTTTAVNVSAALALGGHRVLLIDLDPQSHATLHVGFDVQPGDPTIYDVLVHGAPLAEAARRVGDRLVVVPAHLDLVGAELELADRDEREHVLRRATGPYVDGFDFCILDCAPSLGLLTVNALALVSEVIIPLQPHFLALQGLGRLLETITRVRATLNPALRVSGVVMCMFERGTRLAQEVRDDVQRFIDTAAPDAPWYGARLFEAAIRRNIKLAECPSFGQTIFDYAMNSHGAEDYAALASEILHAGRAATAAPPRAASSPQTPRETTSPAIPAESAGEALAVADAAERGTSPDAPGASPTA